MICAQDGNSIRIPFGVWLSNRLSVVVWRWGTRYGVEYVNNMRSMLARNLHIPYTLYCITDDPEGLHGDIVPVPIWPSEGLGRARRLRIFDPTASSFLADRILQLDIDGVICGDITPLVDREDPLVMWRCVPETKVKQGLCLDNEEDGIGAYNTSMLLMDHGTFPTLWEDYLRCPKRIEEEAKNAGMWTLILKSVKGKTTSITPLESGDDDQAVISLYAKPLNPPIWTEADGVYKSGRRGFKDQSQLPDGARIVFFNGSQNELGTHDWVREHWRC